MTEVLKKGTFEWHFIDDGEKSGVRKEGRGKASQLELGWQKWFGSRVVYKGPHDASLNFGKGSIWGSLLVLPWHVFGGGIALVSLLSFTLLPHGKQLFGYIAASCIMVWHLTTGSKAVDLSDHGLKHTHFKPE